MKISYQVNNKFLLQAVNLPLESGKIFLITGVENDNLGLLGGILGNLFPVSAKIDIPEISALTANYTGTVEITNGALSKNIAYLTADPDRHFLFATVKEELLMAATNKQNIPPDFASFGLDQSFYERRISGLSGGEKMKVALLLTFATKQDCYVLHGVIPWLDQNGRNLLIKQIIQTKKNGACIVFIEHEIESLIAIADEFFLFDGEKITPQLKENISLEYFTLEPNKENTTTNLVEFSNVTLSKHPFFAEERNKPILNNISFTLNTNTIYALTGDNGAGKSTLAQILFRVIKPTSGTIKFLNDPLSNYSRQKLNELICYVGQFPSQQITLSTVGQYQAKVKKANNLLALKVFDDFLKLPQETPVATLSFLHMKFLTLAISINEKTKMLILDEPTWGIDKIGQKILWHLVQDLCYQLPLTILLVSHDTNLISNFTPKIMRLDDGKIITNF